MRERIWLLVILLVVLVGGCSREQADQSGVVRIQAWVHAGQEKERRVIQDQVARFNRQQAQIQVALTMIPERSYNA